MEGNCNMPTKGGTACRIKSQNGPCHLHRASSGHGVVYVLANECMPGIVKVGWTRGDAATRASGLTTTSVAKPFTVAFSTPTIDNAQKIEAAAHRALAGCRVSAGREFFRCTAKYAEDAITEQLEALPAPTSRAAEKASGVHTVVVPAGTTELRVMFEALDI